MVPIKHTEVMGGWSEFVLLRSQWVRLLPLQDKLCRMRFGRHEV